MDSSREEAIARRRKQNRVAQRRFRWNQSQQKSAAAGQREKQNTEQRNGRPVDKVAPLWPSINSFDASSQHPVPTGSDTVSPRLFSPTMARSPVKTCRFRLFGSPSLFAGEWGVDDLSITSPDSAVGDALPTPPSPEELLIEAARQNSDMTLWPNHFRRSSGEILQTSAVDPVFPATLRSSETKEIQLQPPPQLQFSHTKSIKLPLSSQDVAMDPPAEVPAKTSSDNTGSIVRGNRWLGPLHMAAQTGNDRIIRVLLQHEMDCNEKDSDGLTPLYYAITGGFEGIVTSLVEYGARIDQVDSQQRTALHWAVLERREGLLRLLLEYCGGNQDLINNYDSDGMTALHRAIHTGFEAGVQLLLQCGANTNYKAWKN